MMRNSLLRSVAGALLAIVVLFGLAVVSSRAVTLEWVQQFGTSVDEQSYGISSDTSGNVYVAGDTYGNLNGTTGNVAFVVKYNGAGNLQWTQRPAVSYGRGVSADELGNVYVAGWNWLNPPNQIDAYITKYDAAGNFQWLKQLSSSTRTVSGPVSTDGLGNVYIAGSTRGSLAGVNAGEYDAFVAKYDATGNLNWIKQFGTTSFDFGRGVSADGLGNVYVSGSTTGAINGPNAGGWDTFIEKYDSAGNLQWKTQFGTTSDEDHGDVFAASQTIAADGLGNVYISGQTKGNVGGQNAGGWDAYVAKYNASGTLQWTRQLGTPANDESQNVSVDNLGNVFISGETWGDLGGINSGQSDAFLAKFDPAGNVQWVYQLGTSAAENSGSGITPSQSVSADGQGNIYLSGLTRGNLGGPNTGGQDAFVARFSESVPEPSTGALIVVAAALINLPRRRI